jgi:hypothetical protein
LKALKLCLNFLTTGFFNHPIKFIIALSLQCNAVKKRHVYTHYYPGLAWFISCEPLAGTGEEGNV